MSDKAAQNGADQRERNTIIVEDELLRHGFTQIPNILLRRDDISPGAKLTYMVLLSYAWQSHSCFPGHERLASDMGVAKRSIVTYLQQLRDKGLIRVERRGLGQTNVYRLPRFSEVPPQSRSAEFAPLEAQKTTYQEVPNLRPKKYTGEEDSKEKDLDPSNIRKRDLGERNSLASHTPEGLQTDALIINHSTEPSNREVGAAPDAPRNGVASVGSILTRRGAKRRPQGILRGQKPYSDDRQQLLAFIKDFATEFRDEAPLSSSVSRAYNLYTRSGIPLEAFCSFMYEARSLTQEYTSNITKRRKGSPGAFGPELNKMPYFFSILEELISQRSPSTSAPAPEGEPAEEKDHGAPLLNEAGETQQKPAGAPAARTFPETAPAEEPPRRSRRSSQRTIAPSVAIATYIKDLSVECGQGRVDRHDQDQAHRLYAQSGLSETAFLQVLDVVRTLTAGTPSERLGERMPIFLAMVREQLGLDEDSSPTQNTSTK